MTELLLLAYEYSEYLQNSLEYREYIKLNKEIKITYKKEFEQLKAAKEAFESVLEYGQFHPHFKEKASNYSKISKELYSKPLLIKQIALNQKFEKGVNEFLQKLTKTISNNIPILNELGFITNKGGIGCGC